MTAIDHRSSHRPEICRNSKSFRSRYHPREQVFRLRRFPAHPRLNVPQLSCEELCQQDSSGNKFEIGSDELEKSKTQSSSTLIPCVERECHTKGSAPDQAASPPECIDRYLADTAEVNCENSAYSANLSLIQSDDDMPQSIKDFTDSKLDDKNDIRQDAEILMGAFPATSELAWQDFQGKSSFNDEPVETDAKQGGSEMPSCECPKVEPGLSVEQQCELSVAQHAGAVHEDELGCASQFLPESLQPSQGYEDCSETTGEASNKIVDNIVLHDPKANVGCSRGCRCKGCKNVCGKKEGGEADHVHNNQYFLVATLFDKYIYCWLILLSSRHPLSSLSSCDDCHRPPIVSPSRNLQKFEVVSLETSSREQVFRLWHFPAHPL